MSTHMVMDRQQRQNALRPLQVQSRGKKPRVLKKAVDHARHTACLSTEGTYHVGFETVNALILLDVKFVAKLTLCATSSGDFPRRLRD